MMMFFPLGLGLLYSVLVCNRPQLAKASKGLGQGQPTFVDFCLFYKRLINWCQFIKMKKLRTKLL